MNPILWPVSLKAKVASALAVPAWAWIVYQVVPSPDSISAWARIIVGGSIPAAAFLYLARTILNGPKEDAKIRERITKLDGGEPEHAGRGRIGRLEEDRHLLREDLFKALAGAQQALHDEVREVKEKVDGIAKWVASVDPKLVVRQTERSHQERRKP